MRKRTSQPATDSTDRVLRAIGVPATLAVASGNPSGAQCWIAEAWVDSEGRAARPNASGGVGVFAVSVHERYPAVVERRLALMELVARKMAGRIAVGTQSLWIFPGGYFGFDASVARIDADRAWPGFDAKLIEHRMPSVLEAYPSGAKVAFGADHEHQEVWVCWLDRHGSMNVRKITRHECDLVDRRVLIGSIEATFFVCGEFTGSYTENNGPYYEEEYLSDPANQLTGCRLLVDVAHHRVKGTIHRPPGPRLVHQRQILRFAKRGTAILAHHHPGAQTGGRPRNDSQSNWVFFRGGSRLTDDRVHPIS